MSARFLDDAALGPEILDLLKGGNVRCAVAFWGTGAVAKLFPGGAIPQDAQIICDISIGSTNPSELTAMGAPRNLMLKHLRRLHAKVYISDRGAIVCSANASDNGIGFIDVAGLVEVGVHLEPGSQAYKDADDWFDGVWSRAKPMNAKALANATAAWARRPRGGARPGAASKLGPASLLGAVAADPRSFRGVGFVFTTGSATRKDVVEASAAVKRRDRARTLPRPTPKLPRPLEDWPAEDLFTEWTQQDIDAWPRRFVCIHRSGKALSYWFYERVDAVVLAKGRGVVFGDRRRGLRRELGFKHGKQAMMAVDERLLGRIFSHCDENGHWLCESGERLMELMTDVEDAKGG